MRALVPGVFVALLSGCAFVQAHVAQIAIVGTVAGAVSATESAVVNAIAIKNEVEK